MILNWNTTTRPARTLAATALAALALAGCATPYAAAERMTARVQASPAPGFALPAPDLIAAAAGPRVHGSICRLSLTPLVGPRVIRIEHLDAGERVLETATATPVGHLSGKPALGCAYYDLQTRWTLAAADTVRVCATGGGTKACAALES